jgi:hypothetical protein
VAVLGDTEDADSENNLEIDVDDNNMCKHVPTKIRRSA